MSQFVASSASDQLLPPWDSKGCQSWCFVVSVGKANVGDYLKNYFNGAYPDRSPYEYEPLQGQQFGLITYAYHPHVVGRVSPTLGGEPRILSFREVICTFPVQRYRPTANGGRADECTVWVQPFAFYDNASVLFAAREIWGADADMANMTPQEGEAPETTALPPAQDAVQPPAQAEIQPATQAEIQPATQTAPQSETQPATQVGTQPPTQSSTTIDKLSLEVTIDAIRKFSPRSMSKRIACMRIVKPKGGEVQLNDFLAKHSELGEFADLVESFHGAAGAPELNLLKQFRDAYNLREATYRAIVASQANHTDVTDPVFYLPKWVEKKKDEKNGGKNGENNTVKKEIQISIIWSDSIAEMAKSLFGLSPPPKDQSSMPVDVKLAFSFTSDIHFEVIDTLFTYGAGDPRARRPTAALKS